MTPRERSMMSLRGGRPDKIPFLSDVRAPVGTVERELRNRGLCICAWDNTCAYHTPNVKKESIHYQDKDGRNLVKTVYATPHGELSELAEQAGFTSWKHEYLFKSPADYRKLRFLVEDTVVVPKYENAKELFSERGEDVLSVDFAAYSPLGMIMYHYMGTEKFCYEWADNRDEILKLYKSLEDFKRKVLQIAAQSPYEVVIYDANCNPQIISPENFIKYFKPNYEEAVDLMHKNGKLVGSHFDGDNAPYMELIGAIGFDFINAYDVSFSPPIRDARRAWPGKVLWLNYPCAWHLLLPEEIRKKTVQLIEEAEPGNGFIIGITETVPADRILQNFKAILDGIDEYEGNR